MENFIFCAAALKELTTMSSESEATFHYEGCISNGKR